MICKMDENNIQNTADGVPVVFYGQKWLQRMGNSKRSATTLKSTVYEIQ